MVDNMNRHILLAAIIGMAAILTACGGVASNPTAPNFNPPGGQQAAGQPELPGELSGGGAEMGEQVIQGTLETLWPQAIAAMEQGHTVPAAQYFMSAYAAEPQSADAALAYAITDVMRDHRRYAVFMHPGVDKLFMNTPLIGQAEVFPNPFLTEDSYFLRLAALGFRARKLAPTGGTYPMLAPVETEVFFTPEWYEMVMKQQGTEEQPSAGEVPPGAQDGGGAVPPPMPPQVPPGGGPERPVPPGFIPPGGQGDGSGNMSTPAPKPSGTKQGASLGGNGGGHGTPDGQTGGGTGGFPTDFGGPTGVPGGALPERDAPISEDEWEALIRDYRDSVGRDGADMFLSGALYRNLQAFHDEIKEHIANLESVRTVVEAEGYSLSLPFNVLDGTKKVTLMFGVEDYHLILDYYKLLDVLLAYVEAYNHDIDFILPTDAIEDKNADNVLSPDEYLPDAPFGTLPSEGADRLGTLLSELQTALSSHNSHMRPLMDAAMQVQAGDVEKKEVFYLSSFHRNYVLIGEWTGLLRDISEKSTTGTAIKLSAEAGVTDIVAVYDALFSTPVTDIRDYLPSFDFVTRTVITDEEGNWISDPTFNGLYPEGLSGPEIYLTAGRLSLAVYDMDVSKAAGYSVRLGSSSAEVGETGVAVLSDAVVNELAGNAFSVLDKDGQEAGSGTVRTLFEIVPLFDLTPLVAMFAPTGEGIGEESESRGYAPSQIQAYLRALFPGRWRECR